MCELVNVFSFPSMLTCAFQGLLPKDGKYDPESTVYDELAGDLLQLHEHQLLPPEYGGQALADFSKAVKADFGRQLADKVCAHNLVSFWNMHKQSAQQSVAMLQPLTLQGKPSKRRSVCHWLLIAVHSAARLALVLALCCIPSFDM